MTGCPGIYHNRTPGPRKVTGYKPRAYTSVNLWAGITTSGPTKPVVSIY